MDNKTKLDIEETPAMFFKISDEILNIPDVIEAILYTKNLKKPMVLIIEKGINNQRLEIFKGADVRFCFEYSGCFDFDQRYPEIKKILDKIKQWD